jgi:GH24 family phage-related lysozyme (muramidase)
MSVQLVDWESHFRRISHNAKIARQIGRVQFGQEVTVSNIWPSVQNAWVTFNTPLEGMLTYMYTDSEGYVTTGMGNLIDPVSTALALPWQNSDGSPADQDTIQTQWQAVKDAYPGVQSTGCAGLTTIRLAQADVENLIFQKLQSNVNMLMTYFPGWTQLPADAQMGILSMAWAMGPGFPQTFGTFTNAVNTGDWATALAQSVFQGSGIQARIDADNILFTNAGIVASQNLDPSVLYWPNTASAALSVAGSSSMSTGGKVALFSVIGLGIAFAIPQSREFLMHLLSKIGGAV